MASKKFIVKLHHNGVFTTKKYLGGAVFETEDFVDSDRMSYVEIMDMISKDLKYDKVGGVYMQKRNNGVFIPVEDDVAVVNYMEEMEDGATLVFFIDNEVDEIDSATKDQPLVSVQHRAVADTATSKLRQSPRQSVKEKRIYVTLQSLRKQQIQKKSVNRKIVLNCQEHLQEEVRESGQDVEKIRAATIEANKAKFAALGLKDLANSLSNQALKKINDKANDVMEGNEDDSEYIPTDNVINEAEGRDIQENTTKKTKRGRKRNNDMKSMLPKRITRSHANQSLENSSDVNELSKRIILEKEDLRQMIHTPNVAKQLPQHNNDGIGSMEKYLEMRRCQSDKMADMGTRTDVQLSETEVGGFEQSGEHMAATEPEPQVQIVEALIETDQPKMRRYRGQTKLDAIHTRRFEDRKIINLNEDKQPWAEPVKTLTEFSNFLGTLARQYVRLDHVDWLKVPSHEKDQLWDFVQQKYVISEEGRPWVMRTMDDAWRLHKCRVKKKYYKAYDNDNDRRKNRPSFLSDKQFETLLQFWNDAKVQKLAEKNAENRKKIKDQHTCGPIGFARIRKKLQNEKSDKTEPSKAELFIETRKRKEGRQYKDADSSTQEKIARIGELSSREENNELINEVIGEASSHGREWLVGRLGHIKKTKETTETSTANMKSPNLSEEAMEQLKMEVTEEVRNEIREEVRSEVKEEVSAHFKLIIERLTLLNPSLNIDVDDLLIPTEE